MIIQVKIWRKNGIVIFLIIKYQVLDILITVFLK